MKPRTTILLTGVGAPGTPGTLACFDAARAVSDIEVWGTDSDPGSPGQYLVSRFFPVPRPDDDAYLEAMIEASRGADVILPQTTAEVEFLSRTKHRIRIQRESGARVAAAIGSAVKGANSKAAVMRTFEMLGFPAPPFEEVSSEGDLVAAAIAFGWPDTPVVVKPCRSNGSRGVRIITEQEWTVDRFLREKPGSMETSIGDLLQILDSGPFPDLIVMPYLPGPEYSVDCYRGLRGGVAVPRLRKAMRGGITTHAVIEARYDLQEASLAAARQMGLFGAFGFQFLCDALGTPRVIECNPRVQGTMVASLVAGLNAPWLAVQEALATRPEDAPHLPTITYRGQYVRTWTGIHVA